MSTPERHLADTAPTARPDVAEVWRWLEALPDPEIPVISLVDLGIIRDVGWEGDRLIISVTPTYSGCPATSLINHDIEATLRANGIESLELRQQLSPAWTTDWMSQSARAALERYGIAPPAPKGTPTRCPHCGAEDLELLSQFGSTPCKAQWRCKACREPFEYFKCI